VGVTHRKGRHRIVSGTDGEVVVRVAMADAGLDPRIVRTRAAVVEAATALFLEHGYVDTSLDDVAAGAGVSKKTIYNNFADKERLFTEIVLGVTATAEEFAGGLSVSFAGGEVAAFLRGLARRHLNSVTHPGVVRVRRLISAESRRFPALAREYYRRAPARVIAAFADAFAGLSERGLLRVPDSARAAEHFAFLVVGPVLDRVMFEGADAVPDADERARIARAAVGTFLAAYGAEQPARGSGGAAAEQVLDGGGEPGRPVQR
jgi:TetR/AcrR family transcriptional regulator, mexJK operon transcriptional repressor